MANSIFWTLKYLDSRSHFVVKHNNHISQNCHKMLYYIGAYWKISILDFVAILLVSKFEISCEILSWKRLEAIKPYKIVPNWVPFNAFAVYTYHYETKMVFLIIRTIISSLFFLGTKLIQLLEVREKTRDTLLINHITYD